MSAPSSSNTLGRHSRADPPPHCAAPHQLLKCPAPAGRGDRLACSTRTGSSLGVEPRAGSPAPPRPRVSDCVELAEDVRDVAVHGVLAQDERGRDLPVREARGDEPQHLGLASAEGRVAVRRDRRGVVEEAGERALESRWSSIQGRCASPPSGTKRAFGSSDASSRRDRSAPSGRRAGGARARDRDQRQHGRASAVRSSSRNAAATSASAACRLCRLNQSISSPLPWGRNRPASIWEASGQFTRTKSTSDRRVASGMSSPRRVAAEEDELVDPLGRVAANRDVARPAQEQAKTSAGWSPLLAEHGAERARLGLDRRRRREPPVGEPDAEAVVAHDAVPARELLVEARKRGSSHSSSRCETQRPRTRAAGPRRSSRTRSGGRRARRSGSPAPSPASVHGRFGPCQEDGPWRRGGARPASARCRCMHSRYVDGITIRPLRNGDTDTVTAVLDASAPVAGAALRRAEAARLGRELSCLARVDGRAPRARRLGRRRPAARRLAQLVRDGERGRDRLRRRRRTPGPRNRLDPRGRLAADARAAGITELARRSRRQPAGRRPPRRVSRPRDVARRRARARPGPRALARLRALLQPLPRCRLVVWS